MRRVCLSLFPALGAALAFLCFASPSSAFLLPDTGQTKCYEGADPYAEIPCTGTGQDGEYIGHPPSYANNGNGTVTDNNTGLMWQRQDDGVARNWDAAYTYCDNLSLGGHSDWRLPAKKELASIMDHSIQYPGPMISTTYFPGAQQSDYWTSTASIDPSGAWNVDFMTGYAEGKAKDYSFYVRCVRGGQYPVQAFVDNGDGTITDNATGLVWQQGEIESPIEIEWADALSYCEDLTLAGLTDWRLPSIRELESLTDDTTYNPAIDAGFFPNAQIEYPYWSSTTIPWGVNTGSNVRVVRFYNGAVDETIKINWGQIRCVHGGLNNKPALGTLTPSLIATTAGTAQIFTAVYRDADGYADLKTADFLVSPTGSGANSIWARYIRVTNKLRLYNSAGTGLLTSSCTPGVAGSIQNSQGKINCAKTTVAGSGNNLTIKWSITPKTDFADPLTYKKLKMRATDKANSTSGWKMKGSWLVNP